MHRDLSTINGAGHAVADAAIQLNFITNNLLDEQWSWEEAESVFELVKLIAKDLEQTSIAIWELEGKKAEEVEG